MITLLSNTINTFFKLYRYTRDTHSQPIHHIMTSNTYRYLCNFSYKSSRCPAALASSANIDVWVGRKNGAAGGRDVVRAGESDVHNFQEYTYKKITPCDICSQVLRGMSCCIMIQYSFSYD